MSAELDFQAIVDLVGDKLREVFDTGDVDIALVGRQDRPGPGALPYEHHRPLPLPPPWPLDARGPVAG